jgi:hypothetical protein
MSNKVLEARRYRRSKHPADPLQAHNSQTERLHTCIMINFAQTAVGCRRIIRRCLWREQKKVALTYSN